VEIVLATHALEGFGGSESYAVTIAQQLERIGHGVTLYADAIGDSGKLARERGLRVVDSLSELPSEPDAAIVQDGPSAIALAESRPGVAQVFIAHSPGIELQLPPLLDGTTAAVVVMNDRVQERIAAMPLDVEIARLRQPIDLRRFRPYGEPGERPSRALVLSNYLNGERAAVVEAACTRLGIECVVAGRHGERTERPEQAIAAADLVIGYGRSALEGMACGRAVLVLDWFGGDGWVTPDRYPALEADGFAGGALPVVRGLEELTEELAGYSVEMGMANRDLTAKHHSANRHAFELVEVLRRAAGGESGVAPPPAEVGRLLRMLWRHEGRVLELEIEGDELRREIAGRQQRIDELSRELHRKPLARAGRLLRRLGRAGRRDPSK
jgi:hypothetical protein